jgi:hypothetical protein
MDPHATGTHAKNPKFQDVNQPSTSYEINRKHLLETSMNILQKMRSIEALSSELGLVSPHELKLRCLSDRIAGDLHVNRQNRNTT